MQNQGIEPGHDLIWLHPFIYEGNKKSIFPGKMTYGTEILN